MNLGVTALAAVEHQVNMATSVKTGWRIYDPSTRTILDEYIIGQDISSSGTGINPAVAASSLIGRKEAVTDVGIKAGEAYAARILPCWIRRPYAVVAACHIKRNPFCWCMRNGQTAGDCKTPYFY